MDIIEGGTCGSCIWKVDDEMTLTISPQNRKNGVLLKDENHSWPWLLICSGVANIKKVVIKKGVRTDCDTGWMFAGMRSCVQIDAAELDTSAAVDMRHMFEDCRSLTDVRSLAKWDTSGVENMRYMFSDCTSLTDISALEKWDMSRAVDISGMFRSCLSLTDVSALAKWDVSGIKNMSFMFRLCANLADISVLSGWKISNDCEMLHAFHCTKVTTDALDTLIPMACPREGAFIGYKKCRDGRIVQLEIPAEAKRSSAFGRKCRCCRAKVLNIWTADGEEVGYAVSIYNSSFVYHKGETVEVSNFNNDRFDECSSGIHFFMTREDAENYIP